MGLSTGAVDLDDVMEWAVVQAQYLPPTQYLLLLVLCVDAFRYPENPEGALPGQVLAGRSTMHSLQLRTGLGERTIRNAMAGLQEAGYVLATFKRGRGQSRINIYWSEGADERRAEHRAGIRDLPAGFQKKVKPKPKPTLHVVPEADILPFKR